MYAVYLFVSCSVSFFMCFLSRLMSSQYVNEENTVNTVSFYVVVLTIIATTIGLGTEHSPQISFFVSFLGAANLLTGMVIKFSLESSMYESWRRQDAGLRGNNPLETKTGKNSYIIGVGLGNMGMAMIFSGIIVGSIQVWVR